MKKVVFFLDLDGPILDVGDRYYKAYAESIAELGGSALGKDEYWRLKRNRIPDKEILRRTSSERLIVEYQERRNELIEKEDFLQMDNVWRELKDAYEELFKNIPAVLVTLRTYSERTGRQLKNLGIYPWFKIILSHPAIGKAEERYKTKTDLIKGSRAAAYIKKGDGIFIGDTETDILAGKSLGMQTIAVSFGIRAGNLLTPLKPDFLFNTPTELAGHLRRRYL